MTEYRAVFDAEVTFLNGGGLQTQGFRLDVPTAEVTDDQLAELLVGHLGLLMVEAVRLRNLTVIAEPHKGSRGVPVTRPSRVSGRLVELNHRVGPAGVLGTSIHGRHGGADPAVLPLAAVADVPAVVVRLTDTAQRGVGPQALAPFDLAGVAVLLQTGWDRHWGTAAYRQSAPFLTEPAARLLVDAGARLVGIDGVAIDPADDVDGTGGTGQRTAHSILLDAGVPVLEHLTGLADLPVTGARLHAAPPQVGDVVPVRAYAVVPH